MNVFDFVIGVERNAQSYYEILAQRTVHQGMKNIFDLMAQDEEKLCNKLEELKNECCEELADSVVLDLVSTAGDKAGNVESSLAELHNDVEAYEYVLRREADRVAMYRQAAIEEANPVIRSILLQVAAEEGRTLESWQYLYDFASAPQRHLAWAEFSNLSEFRNFGRDQV